MGKLAPLLRGGSMGLLGGGGMRAFGVKVLELICGFFFGDRFEGLLHFPCEHDVEIILL